MKRVEGNIYITTFSSHIHRMQQIIDAAHDEGRKIVFLGRSVREKAGLAINNNYLHVYENEVLNAKQAETYKFNRSNLCIIAAGCQGQSDSAMMKLLTRGVACFKIESGDKVIVSASCIPGNSHVYFSVVNELQKRGIAVVYPTPERQIHVSGHCSSGDLNRFVGFFKNTTQLMPISATADQYQKFADCVAKPHGYTLDEGNLQLPSDGEVLRVSQSGVDIVDRFPVTMVDTCSIN